MWCTVCYSKCEKKFTYYIIHIDDANYMAFHFSPTILMFNIQTKHN